MSRNYQTSDAIQIGRDVIQTEQNGLEALKACIDDNFAGAIDLVLKTKGYLIVVGVGKSGHIGQKIAASFASTGTPSFFMHPTEASHGDLGMVAKDSTLLVISNSGESRELRDVIHYAKKIGVDIIGITRNPESTLGRYSTHALRLPQAPEACPNGLAPTTSTTNTLALADALMVGVMSARGFSKEEFGQRHPGGKLGLQLQTVNDWVEQRGTSVPKITTAASSEEVIIGLTEGRKGCVAVVNEADEFVGLITDGDLRRAMSAGFFEKTAADIMTADPVSLTRDMKISEIIHLFSERQIANAFIVEDKRVIGVIDMKTLLKEGYL